MERGQEEEQGRLWDRRRRWEKQMLLLGDSVPTEKQGGCNTAMQPSRGLQSAHGLRQEAKPPVQRSSAATSSYGHSRNESLQDHKPGGTASKKSEHKDRGMSGVTTMGWIESPPWGGWSHHAG